MNNELYNVDGIGDQGDGRDVEPDLTIKVRAYMLSLRCQDGTVD